jgi:glycosyltransferase involved in cell wall biosynthesis
MGEPNLSIVIPAYNEAANIEPVLAMTMQTLDDHAAAGPYEVIMVNDGSTDETAAAMAGVARNDARIRVLTHDRNRGFGAALLTGFRASTGRFVTLLSADGEIGADQVLSLYALMADHDLVLSRRERDKDVTRTTLSAGFNRLSSWILGFDPSEYMGIYVIRGPLVRALPLVSTTGLLNIELQMRCFAMGCRYTSAVMQVRPRLSGQSKVTNLRTVAKVLFEMIKLRIRLAASRSSSIAEATS